MYSDSQLGLPGRKIAKGIQICRTYLREAPWNASGLRRLVCCLSTFISGVAKAQPGSSKCNSAQVTGCQRWNKTRFKRSRIQRKPILLIKEMLVRSSNRSNLAAMQQALVALRAGATVACSKYGEQVLEGDISTQVPDPYRCVCASWDSWRKRPELRRLFNGNHPRFDVYWIDFVQARLLNKCYDISWFKRGSGRFCWIWIGLVRYSDNKERIFYHAK